MTKLTIKIVDESEYDFYDIQFHPQQIYYSSGIPEFRFDVAGKGYKSNKLFKDSRFEKWLS